jgi:hypothetical protein
VVTLDLSSTFFENIAIPMAAVSSTSEPIGLIFSDEPKIQEVAAIAATYVKDTREGQKNAVACFVLPHLPHFTVRSPNSAGKVCRLVLEGVENPNIKLRKISFIPGCNNQMMDTRGRGDHRVL